MVARPATDYPGSHFNRGLNATWLSIDWVYAPHTEPDIRALTYQLKQRQIAYLFVYTSYLRSNSEFNPTFGYAVDFIRAVRQAQPALKVLAWIGLPLQEPDVKLGDPAIRGKVAAFCGHMVNDVGFDGVHLDPEPVINGDATLLALLDETRRAMGSQALLSLATRHIWPLFPKVQWPLVGSSMWLADYYREIAAKVDQIALMTYDSTLPLADLYRAWTRFQVIALSKAVADAHVEVLIGIPVSEEPTLTHQPRAENMVTGLMGVIDGLNDAEAHPKMISGISIYPHWEISADEWSTYESLWLGHPAR